MSRTKRFYNNPKQRILFEWCHELGFVPYWHPYKVIWSNKWCLDEPLMSKRRRTYNKTEIKREIKNLCPYNSLLDQDECYGCLMRWYGEDCEYMDEIVINSFKEQYPGNWI